MIYFDRAVLLVGLFLVQPPPGTLDAPDDRRWLGQTPANTRFVFAV